MPDFIIPSQKFEGIKEIDYYRKCMIGGILSCGLTHTGTLPIDIVKCRMQLNPAQYPGLISGLKSILKADGVRVLTRGWVPTLIGYSAQGCFKFGLYEFLKDLYAGLLPDKYVSKYKSAIWLCASGSAEIFADIVLCPLEMVKVRMQTSQTTSSGFLCTTRSLYLNREVSKFPYGSLMPLWGRQIPYTMAKFATFEKIVECIYSQVLKSKAPSEYPRWTQLSVTFTSGYLAGIICAIVSQPADNLVTQMAKVSPANQSFSMMIKQIGYKKLFFNGLGPRIIMIGTLTGLQWWIYDSFKTFYGLGTTGGQNMYNPRKATSKTY